MPVAAIKAQGNHDQLSAVLHNLQIQVNKLASLFPCSDENHSSIFPSPVPSASSTTTTLPSSNPPPTSLSSAANTPANPIITLAYAISSTTTVQPPLSSTNLRVTEDSKGDPEGTNLDCSDRASSARPPPPQSSAFLSVPPVRPFPTVTSPLTPSLRRSGPSQASSPSPYALPHHSSSIHHHPFPLPVNRQAPNSFPADAPPTPPSSGALTNTAINQCQFNASSPTTSPAASTSVLNPQHWSSIQDSSPDPPSSSSPFSSILASASKASFPAAMTTSSITSETTTSTVSPPATVSATVSTNTIHVSANLDTSNRKRFTFKTISQRVEEIDIGVFRSLTPLKAELSIDSSFHDALVEWRELNTAEDFISFYEATDQSSDHPSIHMDFEDSSPKDTTTAKEDDIADSIKNIGIGDSSGHFERKPVIVIGMAGNSKTTFLQRLVSHTAASNIRGYILSLDPAVMTLPFGANIDIRDTVRYKEVTPTELFNWAQSQVDYIRGDNPRATSYMVGYDSAYPQQVHHRAFPAPDDTVQPIGHGLEEINWTQVQSKVFDRGRINVGDERVTNDLEDKVDLQDGSIDAHP